MINFGFWPYSQICTELDAKVAELVDALALGASGETRESSSLSFRTTEERLFNEWVEKFDGG